MFTGYGIGSFFSGLIADKYGRRLPLLVSSMLIFIIALLCAFSFNFWMLLSLRAVFGILIGFSVPISFSILAEN